MGRSSASLFPSGSRKADRTLSIPLLPSVPATSRAIVPSPTSAPTGLLLLGACSRKLLIAVLAEGTPPSHQAVSFSANSVASGLHQLMAEPNTEAAVPLVIHTLGAAQDRGAAMVALAAALGKAGIVLSSGGSQEMIKYPIQCYEPWARDQATALVDKSSFEYHLDSVTARWWQYVCTLIPQSAQAAHMGPDVLSGAGPGFERACGPPGPTCEHGRCARALAGQPRTGRAGPGTRINWQTWQSCTGPLIGAFIVRATVANLDTSCVPKAHGQPFALTLGAIAPGH